MKPAFRAVLLAAFSLSILASGFSQRNAGLADAVSQLLDYPAPPPPTLKDVAEALAANVKWSKSSDVNSDEPGEDAPPKVLIDYWDRQVQYGTDKRPSERSQLRLLEAVLEEPRFYSRTLNLLPDTPEAHERVKRLLDQSDTADTNPQKNYYNEQARESLRSWLSRHSGYYRDLLIQHAKKVDEGKSYFKDDPDLEALAKLDSQTAKPIIERYVSSNSRPVAAYALGLLYAHERDTAGADMEGLRERLKRLVVEKSSPARVREIAAVELMKSDWPGQDAWFLSLFAESFPSGSNGDELAYLAEAVEREPDHWIPILTEMVSNTNSNIHNAAVFCLAQLNHRGARVNALRPLLPWLSNSSWSSAGDRFTRERVIDRMALVPMPECIPGLLAVVQNEKDRSRLSAAQALGKYGDRRAIPVLRRAIEKESVDDYYSTEEMIKALIACGGLSDDEKITAIEAIATEGKAEVIHGSGQHFFNVRDAKSVQGTIGHVLIKQRAVSDFVAAAITKRSKEVRNTKPGVSENLWLIALQLNFPSVDSAIAERIIDGSADLNTLLIALERREHMRASAVGILKPLLSRGGHSAGVSAVLLSDLRAQASILAGQDATARVALLACARMVRDSLPVEQVGKLLAQSGQLRLAAERYLETIDSPDARKLARAQRPDDILIQGARGVFDPKEQYREDWVKWENGLVEDVKNRKADEVLGEIEFHYSDTAPGITRYSIEIRVRSDEAEVCKRADSAREECRPLLRGELQALRALFEDVSFDDLPPVVLAGHGLGGSEQEFVRIDKRGGRRVYAANLYRLHDLSTWSLKNQIPHEKLASFFSDLKNTGKFELRYALATKIKDLEVLAADDNHPVKCVCAEGGELRVLVKDKEENWEAMRKGQRDDSLNWHVLSDGKIGAVTE